MPWKIKWLVFRSKLRLIFSIRKAFGLNSDSVYPSLKENVVFEKVKKHITKGVWHSVALVIVILFAGPEIMVSMELMSLVEALGASTFVMMYLYGLKAYVTSVWNYCHKFEAHSILFIPSWDNLKEMPSMIIHAIPERACIVIFFATMLFVLIIQVTNLY